MAGPGPGPGPGVGSVGVIITAWPWAAAAAAAPGAPCCPGGVVVAGGPYGWPPAGLGYE